MTWEHELNVNTPAGTDNPREGYLNIQNVKKSIIERMDKEHHMPLTDGQVSDLAAGEHKAITLRKQDTAPLTGEDKHAIYAKEVDGKLEMFSKDADGNEVQLTNKGALAEPVGVIKMYAGTGVPTGWLSCHGQLVSKTTYAKLYAVCQNYYGEDGDNFNLPDFSGRTAYGSGNSSTTGSSNLSFGSKVGSMKHQLTEAELPVHSHPHQHNMFVGTMSSDNTVDGGNSRPHPYEIEKSTYTGQGDAGGDAAHDNLSPGTVVGYIIKYE